MKNKLVFILALLVIVLTGCITQDKPNQTGATPKYYVEKRQTLKTNLNVIPALFFHGGLNNYKGEENMAEATQEAGVTSSMIRANVDTNGKVKSIDTTSKNDIGPIVEVNYHNNVQLGFKEHGRYARNAVQTLQSKYGIKKVDMVGHSLGNISIMYYLLQTAYDPEMPKLSKQVLARGHFNGPDFKQLPITTRQPPDLHVDAEGKPNKTNSAYREIMRLRTLYPNKQTSILNITGNVGGNSSGIVRNASSPSLEYLVEPMAKNYRVVEIVGKNAEHEQLTYDKQVEKEIIRSSWLQ